MTSQENLPFGPQPAPPETVNPPVVDDAIEDAPGFLVEQLQTHSTSPGLRIAGKFPHPAQVEA